jgi:uroporphyrinogen-III synthase
MPELPRAARDMLLEKKIDAALFFSARSARIFKDAAAGLPLETVIAICIGDSTAAALSPLSFQEIRVAEKPNQDALLACLSS